MNEPPEHALPPTTKSPSAAGPPDSTSSSGAPSLQPSPAIPDHELLRCIGRGSYGEVWLARNIMGTYRAVKIVYRATFDSDRPYNREFEGLKKFEPVSRSHESQVDILHVGRNDAAGYFYHVMELGDDQHTCQAIDPERYEPKTLRSELKARGRLSLEECLRLGLALTTALEHLHKNGLIHRDIKPSNIIYVNGLPKLADIGLVATLDATCSFVGTEGYMPPEGPGTPQADLYSLGKVLYETSTGKDRREFPELPAELGPPEEEKGILELNAVVVKACKPEAKRRYQSAGQMHEDLLLLVAGKSVRRTHVLERRLKFMTRAGLAAAAVLVLGAFPYYLAIKEARVAKTQAARSKQVAQLLKDMLEGVGPSVAKGRDTTLLKEILDETARRLSTELSKQPEVEADLSSTLCEVYMALGDYRLAEQMARRELALNRQLFGQEHQDVATALDNLAVALYQEGNLAEAETMQRQGLAMRRRLLGNNHEDVAYSLNNLSSLLLDSGKSSEAAQLEREALVIFERSGAGQDRRYASALGGLSAALSHLGKFDEAEKMQRELVTLWTKLEGLLDVDTATALNNLADVLGAQGKAEEALITQQEALDIKRTVLGEHSDVAWMLHNLGRSLRNLGRLDEAEAALREALAMRRKLLGDDHPDVAASLRYLGGVLSRKKEFAEAESAISEATGILDQRSPDAVVRFMAQGELGIVLMRQKRYTEAEPCLLSGWQGLQSRRDRVDSQGIPFLRAMFAALVDLFQSTGRPLEAAEWKQKLAELEPAQAGPKPSGAQQ